MSQRLRYAELAPEGLARLRAFEHYLNTATTLPAPLLEFIRLRASLLNGCEFCVEMHKPRACQAPRAAEPHRRRRRLARV